MCSMLVYLCQKQYHICKDVVVDLLFVVSFCSFVHCLTVSVVCWVLSVFA